LGGNNALNKNFFQDDRVAWWCPINEAKLDDPATIQDVFMLVTENRK